MLVAIYHEVAQGVLEEAVGSFGLPHAARPWHREAAGTAGVCQAEYPGTRRRPLLLPISLQCPLLTKLTMCLLVKGKFTGSSSLMIEKIVKVDLELSGNKWITEMST